MTTDAVLTFARPQMLWLLLALAAAVSFLILPIGKKTLRTTAYFIWEEAIRRIEGEKSVSRAKKIARSLLWALIVAALIFAAAGPKFVEDYEPKELVIIIDNSASMNAMDNAPPGVTGKSIATEDFWVNQYFGGRRIGSVFRLASAFIEATHPDDYVYIIETCPRPALVASNAREKLDIHTALRKVGYSWQNLDEVALKRLLSALPPPERERNHYFFSDGAGVENETLKRITYHSFVREENLAITGFEILKDPGDGTYILTATIKRFTDTGRLTEGPLEITATIERPDYDGESDVPHVDRRILALSPAEETSYSVNLGNLSGTIRLSITPGDFLLEDNSAWAELPDRKKLRIIFVGKENATTDILSPALFLMGDLVDTENSLRTTPEGLAQITGTIKPEDVVVFDSVSPTEELPKAKYIFFASGGKHVPVELTGLELNDLAVTNAAESPVTRYIEPEDMHIERALEVMPGAYEVSLSSDNIPLLVKGETQAGLYYYFAFDVKDSNLPVIASFPVLLRNIIASFSEVEKPLFHPCYKSGDVIKPLRDAGASETWFHARIWPFWEKSKAPHIEGKFERFRAWDPGEYKLDFGYGKKVIGQTYVNFVNPEESNIIPSPQNPLKITPIMKTDHPLLDVDLWKYLLWLAALLLCAEIVFEVKSRKSTKRPEAD